jgi:hypothetical protein
MIFRPVATLWDWNVALCWLLMNPRSLARWNSPVGAVISFLGVGIPVSLYLVLHPLWLVSGRGEANFLFFQCLAYQAMVGCMWLECTLASVGRIKALRLTHKLQTVSSLSSSVCEVSPTANATESTGASPSTPAGDATSMAVGATA